MTAGDRRGEPASIDVRHVSLVVIALAVIMYTLSWAREVFIPIVLSVLISYLLDPIVIALTRLRVPRVAGSALAVLLLAGSVAYTGYALADDAAAVIAELPDAAEKLRAALQRGWNPAGPLEQVQRAASELQQAAEDAAGQNPVAPGVQRVQIERPPFNARKYLSLGSAGVVLLAGEAVLVLFFVFFLLAAGNLFKRKLVKIAGPSLERKKVTLAILDEIDAQIARFMIVRAVASTVVGVATWMVFRLVGLDQAGVWGLCAGLFNSIPYFGPALVAAGTFVVAFVQFGTMPMAIYVAGLSLTITSLEGWLLTPWLTSRTTRTNEVSVFLGLIVFSFVWGIWGTLLAVPMLVAVKAFCDRIDDLKPFGELLGD